MSRMNTVFRHKILISAYACEPNRGSEPEVGWQWVIHLVKYCDVTVITRSNNQKVIEDELKGMDEPLPKFVYVDLSSNHQWLKKHLRPQNLAVSVYYSLWQGKVRRKIDRLKKDYDLIHHLTFASFRLPFAVAGHEVPCIVGPVGGCEIFPPALFPCHGFKIKLKELVRNWITSVQLSVGLKRYLRVNLTLAATAQMGDVFKNNGVNMKVMSQIGMPYFTPDNRSPKLQPKSAEFRLLFVGNILYWKGVELALHSLLHMPENVTLTYVGSGPDMSELKKEVARLNLAHRVRLLGRKPRNEVLKIYKEFDLFFYPSLHDSGSFTVLEAMTAGLAVICLDRGGPATSVTPECGRVVSQGSRKETCQKLADSVKYYLDNPSELTKHGERAQKRVSEVYNWERKAEQMIDVYRDVIEAYNKRTVK